MLFLTKGLHREECTVQNVLNFLTRLANVQLFLDCGDIGDVRFSLTAALSNTNEENRGLAYYCGTKASLRCKVAKPVVSSDGHDLQA